MTQRARSPDLFIRRLWAMDRVAIRGHFLRLDAESRRLRFGAAMNDEGIRSHADGVLSYGTVACGGFVDGHLRAVAELRDLCQGWRPMAEAAFSVETPCQNVGIGDALIDRIVAIAQNRGVKTLHMTCLSENVRMKRLAEKHRAQLEYSGGFAEATLVPDWPTPLSLMKEIGGETMAFAHSMLTWPCRGGPA